MSEVLLHSRWRPALLQNLTGLDCEWAWCGATSNGGILRSLTTATPSDPKKAYLGPSGCLRGGRQFLMSKVPCNPCLVGTRAILFGQHAGACNHAWVSSDPSMLTLDTGVDFGQPHLNNMRGGRARLRG